MRLLTSISIGAFAGAVTAAAQPSLQTVYTKEAAEHGELVPTGTIALELRNADAAVTTIVAAPTFQVTLCPQPTGSYAALRTEENLLYGCKPGYVCNPPKPAGCNLWPGPPPIDFQCQPEFCMPAPPLTLPHWHGKPGYYPPQHGYFNLNPEDFGLSYDIFEYSVVRKASGGHTSTYTTGNWGPQASLTNGPVQTPLPGYKKRYSPTKPQAHRGTFRHAKRDGTLPDVCFQFCSNAYTVVQKNGMIPSLCEPGSEFENDLSQCITCITGNLGIPVDQVPLHMNETYREALFFCDGQGTTPTSSSTASGPESQVTTSPTFGTTSQASASPTSFIDTTTSSSVQSTTKQSTTAPPPPPTSTSSSSTTSSSSSSSSPPTSSSPPPPTSTPPTSSSSSPPPPPTSTTSSSSPPPSSSTPSSAPPSSSTPSSAPPSSSTPSSAPPSSTPPSSSASLPPSGTESSASSTSGSASSSASASGSASSDIGTAPTSASSETGSTSASASSSASASNGASVTGSSASSPTTGGTGAAPSSTGTNSPTGAGSSTGAGSPTGTGSPSGTGPPSGTSVGTGTTVGTGAGSSTGTTAETGTGSPTGAATGTEPPTVTGTAIETGTNLSTGFTSPVSGFTSPGQLERASSTGPGNAGGAGPTGTNEGGNPGGAGPTGAPGNGGGNPGGNPGGSGGGGGNGGATGTGPITSPTSGLPISNDLSRPSENFGLLIAAILGLLVV